MGASGSAFTEGVGERLGEYAGRGAFRSFARVSGGVRSTWRVRWHRDLPIEIVADGRSRTVTLKDFLPGVDRPSALDRNLRAFVASQTGNGVPAHRRLGRAKEAVKVTNRGGSVSIALTAEPGADGRALADRAVLLGQQIHTLFLREGGYDDYLVQALGVDLDAHM